VEYGAAVTGSVRVNCDGVRAALLDDAVWVEVEGVGLWVLSLVPSGTSSRASWMQPGLGARSERGQRGAHCGGADRASEGEARPWGMA
jgi:hypothetical protein